MSNRRAVITGIGAVTAAGVGAEKTWNAFLKGPSGLGPITFFPTEGFRTQIAGEATAFSPGEFMDDKLVSDTERFTQLALAAASLALKDSARPIQTSDVSVGVAIGCGMGGLPFFENQSKAFFEKGPSAIRPSSVPRIMPSAAAAQIAARWKFRGANTTISTACSSSNHAIGQALDWIRAGRCATVVCGGAESLLSPITFAAFDSLRVMSRRNASPKTACRPFDKDRDGFVMGEGAVLFIVEEYEAARARRAKIYAEVAGYGAGSGAYNILAPEPDGAEAGESMDAALRDAGISPKNVDYIHAHGTATRNNDLSEALAIRRTFGRWAPKIAVSSTKPVTGHTLGAAGAIGTLACAMAIADGKIPPTLNLQTPDPECDLNHVRDKARVASVRVALSNAFAFGNNNASIVLRKFD